MRRLVAACAALVAAAVSGSLLVAPAARAEGSPTVTFATWNVCKLDCASPAPSWDVRRLRIARTIEASGADVIAINEATNNRYGARTQWDDIRSLVAKDGLASPVIQDDQCGRMDCENTARLLFRTSTIGQLDLGRLASAGSVPISEVAPGISAYPTRQVTWAYLTGKNGAGAFLAISAHLTNDKSAYGERHRVAFGRSLTGWATRMNAERGLDGIPVVLMGDLNSYDDRQPRGVQRLLRNAGWRDSLSAPVRRNADINSVNMAGVGSDGWPKKPFRYRGRLANRIDYIMSRGPILPRSYEVVVHLTPSGAFDPEYQGSDHNMVKAKYGFTSPVPPPKGLLDPDTVSSDPAQDSGSALGTSARIVPATLVTYELSGGTWQSRASMITVPARMEGTTVVASPDGVWIPIPYIWNGRMLLYSPRLLAPLGLTSDPVGSQTPPAGFSGMFSLSVP